MSPPIRTRYAPSPTGRLHLGNLRTALLVWLDTRARGGELVLRMEDLDRRREIPGAAGQQLADLRRLGLDWDEGPDVGGPAAPYVQSERFGLYEEVLERLLGVDLAYPCLCTRKELREAASAPSPGEESRYPGTCAHLSIEQALKKGQPFALRFRASCEEIRFRDRIFGEQVQNVHEAIGDFVIRRKDAVAAYQLAVVLDDIAMGVTDVIRGADLLPSTPRQVLLYRALGEPAPRYGHVPLLLNSAGEKFSKRERDVHAGTLREAGRSAEEIVGYLAWTAGLIDPPEAVRPADLLAGFSLERVHPKDTAIDPLGFLERGLRGASVPTAAGRPRRK